MARLTREQAAQLRDRVREALGFLSRFLNRLELRGFDTTGPLYRNVLAARNAMQALYMDLHYKACDSGVGGERED
jgi:hypothetical protein